MTNGPWKGDTRPTVNGGPLGMSKAKWQGAGIALGIVAMAIGVVTMMPPEWAGLVNDDPRVDRAAYARLADIAKGCPATRPAIRRAMMDGYATRSEFDAVLKVANARVDDYLEANARNDAAIASGAPAVRTPPRCVSS